MIATLSLQAVLSHTTEYALRATIYIARQGTRPVRIPEVARAANAPPRYLAKILSQLARAGVLTSARGRAGGFRVAPLQEQASLASVMAVFEHDQPRRCLLGHGVCGQNPGCTVHDRWAPIATRMNEFFARTTIADLLSPRPSS